LEKRILVTGSAGFIGGYVVQELLDNGWEVYGIDNYSKYGRVKKSYDDHPKYKFFEGDVKNVNLMKELCGECSHLLAGAAMIGGISYFHEYAYDLLAENERIVAATFDAAIDSFKKGRLKKITVMSSSMVFESASVFPTPEGAELTSPPPMSTYGFQKLACEYFARGAHQQYGLPYTIVRPFNCVGIGEQRALSDKEVLSGNVKLAMSHVVPDLIQKVVKGQDPLHILGDGNQVRHYTYGGDLARGIRIAVEHPAALNEDFNLSTETSTSVIELAEIIWKKIRGNDPFRYVSDKPFYYDVQKRVPDCSKAKRVLGYEAVTPLETILDEVVPWVQEQIKLGTI
jgi:UDP-glucose 4-epimerase